MIKIKRAYEKPAKTDGQRILVDRLWPRGLSKKEAKIDLWLKDIAPSNELRKWFGHEPEKWLKFLEKYFKELDKNQTAVNNLKEMIKKEKTTLIYAAKNPQFNQAKALIEYLANKK